MRLDKYLKVSRLIKRRTVANEACDAGRVMINGKTAKAGAEVKAGDVIEIGFGTRNVKVEVLDVQETTRGFMTRCASTVNIPVLLYIRRYRYLNSSFASSLRVVSYNRRDSEYPAVSRCIWMNSK